MKTVDRSEILDLGAYEQIRGPFRARVIEMKKRRRVMVGPHMTFLFENHDTVLMQVQEMLRTERISAEKGVLHELETYNELIPGPGEVSATLMIQYDDQTERRRALDAMADLAEHVALLIGDTRCVSRFRPLPGEETDRLPAVNYLSIAVPDAARDALRAGPVKLVVSHPHYGHEAELGAATRAELADDLES